jgi:hypothetical protein
MNNPAFIFLCLFLSSPPCQAADYHVSPAGTPGNDGSESNPWDLVSALSATDRVKPGDTIWLHAGTYRGGCESQLRGEPGNPVVVRAVPGDRVTLDLNPRDEKDNASLVLLGADVIYRDFEVTCTHPKRVTGIAGSWPEDLRRGSVTIKGDRISALNLVVHDLGTGFGFWSEGEGGEISGCLIYYNGWRGPDRGHGHGIYTQNAKGTKRIRDNVIFHQFGHGIQAYGSEKASLKGFEIEGNVIFDNGVLTKAGERSTGLLVGGATPAERIVVRDNWVVSGGIRLGYTWGVVSRDLICEGNYTDGLVVRDFLRGRVSRNTVVAHSQAAQWEAADTLLQGGLIWNDNTYHVTDGRWGECSVQEKGKTRSLTFAKWQEETGHDADSTFQKGAPSQLRVTVRPNAHEPGRALIAVLNPEGLPRVEVDLSGSLKPGQPFRIVSVRDVFGPALVTGIFEDQAVGIPLRAVKGPLPIGLTDVDLPVTEPAFAAFLLLPGR